MAKTKFSQEQLLVFMAKVMSIVENRRYSFRHVHLCSKHNLLLKNQVVVGHMDIIADDSYWELIDYEFLLDIINYTEQQYCEKAQFPKRALFLKYTYRNSGEKSKFKNMPNRNTLTRIGSNIDDFPYLLEAITRLNNNAEAKDCYDYDIIEETLEEIKSETSTYRAKAKDITISTKALVKKLNEPEQYRHYYDDKQLYYRYAEYK